MLRSVKSKSINMPDGTDHPSRQHVVNFVRHAPAALRPKGTKGGVMLNRKETKGGVMLNRNGILYTVDIRPSRWKIKPCQFWIGKQSYEWAQYKADAIFHYTGKPRFHYKDAYLVFPLLECMGTVIGTRVLLETPEVRLNYVQSIAGEAFTFHRGEFIRKVMEVMKTTAFIDQGKMLLNSTEEAAAPGEEAAAVMPREEEAAPREVEGAVLSEGVVKDGDDDDHFEDTPPLEEDPMSCQALREIQHSAPLSSDMPERLYPACVLHTPGSDMDSVRVLDFSQAYAPSFEINPNSSGKKSLQSVGQSFGSMSFSMKDCPETLKKDTEKYRSWMETIAELNKRQKIGG